MKISKLYLLLLFVLPLLASCGPGPDDPAPAKWGYWKIKGQEFTSVSTTVTDSTAETDCTDNHKIWVTFGAMPTGEKTLKVVPYSKAHLAADEVKFDVAHGNNLDYLTTGTNNVTVDIGFISDEGFPTDVLFLVFNDVPVQGYGGSGPNAGDTTTVSGYIQLQ